MTTAQEFYQKRHGKNFEPPKTAAWGHVSTKPKRSGPGPEKQIQDAIMEYLTVKRIFFWRNNTGVARMGQNSDRFVRFGAVGSPDIFAMDEKILYGIEVKSPKGKVSEAQKKFGEKIEAAGGVYIVARSVDDIINIL